MSPLAAIFVYHVVTLTMSTFNIFKPDLGSVFGFQLVKETFLAQIFHYNFLSLNHVVRRFYRTILATSIAILIDIPFVAIKTFPKHVVRCKVRLFTQ